jgi:hypothetical protein
MFSVLEVVFYYQTGLGVVQYITLNYTEYVLGNLTFIIYHWLFYIPLIFVLIIESIFGIMFAITRLIVDLAAPVPTTEMVSYLYGYIINHPTHISEAMNAQQDFLTEIIRFLNGTSLLIDHWNIMGGG